MSLPFAYQYNMMTKEEKMENILRNLRDLHRRSQQQDENLYGKGAESIMTALIELVEDVVEEMQEPEVKVTITDIDR